MSTEIIEGLRIDLADFYDGASSSDTPRGDIPPELAEEQRLARGLGFDRSPLPEQATHAEILRHIGADVPPEIAELRKADQSGRMFADSPVPQATLKALETAVDRMAPDTDSAVRAATVSEWAAIGTDLGLGHGDVAQIAELAVRDGPRAHGMAAAWQRQADVDLGRVFGSEKAAALQDARRLVARDPRLHRMLDATGLGNHPVVVVRLAQQARALRAAGRLK